MHIQFHGLSGFPPSVAELKSEAADGVLLAPESGRMAVAGMMVRNGSGSKSNFPGHGTDRDRAAVRCGRSVATSVRQPDRERGQRPLVIAAERAHVERGAVEIAQILLERVYLRLGEFAVRSREAADRPRSGFHE